MSDNVCDTYIFAKEVRLFRPSMKKGAKTKWRNETYCIHPQLRLKMIIVAEDFA